MGRPKRLEDEEETEAISARIARSVVRQIDAEGEATGKTRSMVVHRILSEWAVARQARRALTPARARWVVHHMRLDDPEHTWHGLQAYAAGEGEAAVAQRIWARILHAVDTEAKVRALFTAATLEPGWDDPA